MATEKILIFDEAGNAKRMKVRIARFLDNEPVTASDKENIRTTLDVDDSLSGTFTTPLSVTSASDSSFTGGGKVGIGTDSPSAGAVGGQVVHVQSTGETASVRVDRSDASTAGTLSLTAGNTTLGVYGTGSKDLVFSTNGTSRWTINSTGNLVASSGVGIDFGSGDILDTYEEGTHTTTLTPSTSGTITLNSSNDRIGYTRVGDLVTITGTINLSSVSSPVGNYIGMSLPYAIANMSETAGGLAGAAVVFGAAGNSGDYSWLLTDGDSVARLYKTTGVNPVATAADFSGDESIYVNFTYHAA